VVFCAAFDVFFKDYHFIGIVQILLGVNGAAQLFLLQLQQVQFQLLRKVGHVQSVQHIKFVLLNSLCQRVYRLQWILYPEMVEFCKEQIELLIISKFLAPVLQQAYDELKILHFYCLFVPLPNVPQFKARAFFP
jgi:hypothetical protein